MIFEDKKLQTLVNLAVSTLKESVKLEESNIWDDEHDAKLDAAFDKLGDYCFSLLPASVSAKIKNRELFAAKVIDKYVWSQI